MDISAISSLDSREVVPPQMPVCEASAQRLHLECHTPYTNVTILRLLESDATRQSEYQEGPFQSKRSWEGKRSQQYFSSYHQNAQQL